MCLARQSFHARSRIVAALVEVNTHSSLPATGQPINAAKTAPGEPSDDLISSRPSLRSSRSSSTSTSLPKRLFVGPVLPSARKGATSIHAKKPSDVCYCRGTCPSSPKHAPSATRRETLAQKYPVDSRLRRVQHRWSCNVLGRVACLRRGIEGMRVFVLAHTRRLLDNVKVDGRCRHGPEASRYQA
jgi:hypothetical protein